MSSTDTPAAPPKVNTLYLTLTYNYFNPAQLQEVVFNEVQVEPQVAHEGGFFAKVRTIIYNATDKTILGKTKEKWLFILLGVVVVVMLTLLFVGVLQRSHQASASEYTSAKCNKTGRYFVVRRGED